MAMEYEYTVTLHGNKEKLKWAEGIIDKAVYNSSPEMEDFLQEYAISVSDGYKDADCHHLSLLAMLFCKTDKKETVANEAWRDFLSGCYLKEDDTLDVYCRIAGNVDGFFRSLVEHSDYLESYDAVCDENDEEEEYNEKEYDNEWEDNEEHGDGAEETNGSVFTGEKESVSGEETTENLISKSSAPLMIEIYGDDDRLEMAHRIIMILLEDKSTLCSVTVLPVIFSPMSEQAPLAGLGEGISIVDIYYEIHFDEDYLSVKCQSNKDNNEFFNYFLQRLCESSPFINRITLKNGTTSYNFTKGNLAQPVNAF